MYVVILSLSLIGQADIPPAPAADLPPASLSNAVPTTVEEMRAWLLAHLIVDMNFDAAKSAEAGRLLNSMNAQQLRVLIDVYKDRTAKRDVATKAQQETDQQQLVDTAKLNLQKAEAYRDFLKREYDRQVLQGHMTQNLVYQNIVNNQAMMYRTNGPVTYGAFGYGPVGVTGLGYGIVNYGGFGYGAPGFGAPGIYGYPAYGGLGMW